MRTQLGWLTFLLAVLFAGGFVLTLIGATWYGISDTNGVIGFFGFGIPMMAAGLGTAGLWSEKAHLEKTLGWASTMLALTCGVALFILVAGWIMSDETLKKLPEKFPSISKPAKDTNVIHFIGFAAPMAICGGFGVMLLLKTEGKTF